ncbi:MAG: serine protease [Ruminococcaceae bacterium]|nr:serine protease [Oscillospiraceae bacterium]
MKRICVHILALFMILSFGMNMVGCGYQIQAENLMDGIEAETVAGKEADDAFLQGQMAFSLDLFQRTVAEGDKENMLISPLSVMLALSMTANGADGETKAEMEEVLGMPIEELNAYLYSYVKALPSGDKFKLQIANSIWFRDAGFTVNPDFLKTNANYYGASAYQAPFNAETVKDINAWVNKHTDGMIKKIVEGISPDMVMYLVNAVMFDAKWDKTYKDTQIRDRVFTSLLGEERNVKMMYSTEDYYLQDENAVGFFKQYKGGHYSFAALLPHENVDIYDYIAQLDAKELLETLNNAEKTDVEVCIPKFSYEYSLIMNDILQAMGMGSAFGSSADFSKLGSAEDGNIYIGEVRHKTYISLDDKGTKASAATSVGMKAESATDPEEQKTVYLDRPFVYMIIDNATNLPIFMGTVTDIIK